MPNTLVTLYLKCSGVMRRLRRFLWAFDLRMRGVKIGKRLKVRGPIYVVGGRNITIGDDCILYDNVYLNAFGEGRITIGNKCSINRMTIINCHESVTLGDRVHIGPMCFITDQDHTAAPGRDAKGLPGVTSPVVIEGPGGAAAGCIILRGVRLGPRTIVAAGAVVTHSFPGKAIIAGVPAQVLKERPEFEGEVIVD